MSELLVERRDKVTHLIVNRADRANALNAALVDAFHVALDAAETDGTRLLVIRANGRNFCSGFDLSTLDDETAGDLVLRLVRIEQLLQRVYHFPAVTAALARGRVYGAGADLFCCCNYRICTSAATFRFPGVGFGVVLGTRRLAARIGADAATATLLEGRELNAAEAVAKGLATAEQPESDWDQTLGQLTETSHKLAVSTTQALLNCLRIDTRDSDLAALTASVAAPEFVGRIRAYRDRVLKRN